jgi:hypothetical protein
MSTAQEAADPRYDRTERIVILTNPFMSLSITGHQYSSSICVKVTTFQDLMDVHFFEKRNVMKQGRECKI